MKKFSLLHFFSFFMIICILSACERSTQSIPEESEIVVFQEGKLELSKEKNFPKTLYIDIRDETGQIPLTPEVLPRLLAHNNYEVVDNPSKAAYILHIALLREGQTDPQILEKLVREGFDSKAELSGSGHSAWLADALLVQRRIPEAKRESQVRLKNISARNALGSSQMRLSVSTPVYLEGRQAYIQAFVPTLAKSIHEALVGKDPNPALQTNAPAPNKN